MSVMGATENKRLMRRIFDGLAQGDGRLLIDSLADDFRWTLIGTTEWSRTYEGKQAVVAELLRPLFAQFETRYTNTASLFVAEGDHVVVECRGQVGTKHGTAYNNTYCWVCRFSGERLQELTEYCDTELIATALRAPDAMTP